MKFAEKTAKRVEHLCWLGLLALSILFFAGHVLLPSFPLSGPLLALNYTAMKAAGLREANGVYLGRGRLYAVPELPDAQTMDQLAADLSGFAESARCPVTFMAVPDAAWVLPGSLPYGAVLPDEEKVLNWKIEGVNTVNCMLEMKKQKDPYYRTDSSWTVTGAYAGYAALQKALGYKAVSLDSIKLLEATSRFQGNLAEKTGDPYLSDTIRLPVPPSMPDYVMEKNGNKSRTVYQESALDSGNKLAVFPHGSYKLEMDNESGLRLVILSDGSADALVPLLIPHCRTISVVDVEDGSDLSTLLERDMATQCLVVCSMETLAKPAVLLQLLGDNPGIA